MVPIIRRENRYCSSISFKQIHHISNSFKPKRFIPIKRTYNGPEYFVGSGATIDLFILLIRACISFDKK